MHEREGTLALSPQVHNEGGKHRVIVSKALPGERWLNVLTNADCRVEVCQSSKAILSKDDIKQLIGGGCTGLLGQLTEVSHSALSSEGVICQRTKCLVGLTN